MDPKKPQTNTPSLLADPQEEESAHTATPSLLEDSAQADIDHGTGDISSGNGNFKDASKRRRIGIALIVLVLCAIIALIVIYAFGSTNHADASLDTHAKVDVKSWNDAATTPAGAPGSTPTSNSAAIVTGTELGKDSSGIRGYVSHGNRFDQGGSEAGAETDSSKTASSARDQLLARFDNHPSDGSTSDKQKSHYNDSDISLLAALITHVKKGGSDAWQKVPDTEPQSVLLKKRMQACPKASTTAGIKCRKRICEGHVGEISICPAPTGKD